MLSNNPIRSDDPQAIEKLTAKLKSCQEMQEYMKEANKYYRRNGTMKGFPDLDDEKAELVRALQEIGAWMDAMLLPGP